MSESKHAPAGDIEEMLRESVEIASLPDWRERMALRRKRLEHEKAQRDRKAISDLTDAELVDVYGSIPTGLAVEAATAGNGWTEILRAVEVQMPADSRLRVVFEAARDEVESLVSRLIQAAKMEAGK